MITWRTFRRDLRCAGAGIAAFLIACALVIAVPAAARAQGVHVALVPVDSTVTPGSEFVVRIALTEAGSEFNGYDAVIEFDPDALTFLQASPLSQQEGSYMKNACGSTFHRFIAGPDSLTITHVLLCNQLFLTGPGVLYKLRFRAADVAQLTEIRFRLVKFYRAGFFVNPVYATNALIRIGNISDAEDAPPRSGVRLRAAPNPFNPTTVLQVETSASGQQALLVRDARGCAVRRLQEGVFPAGSRAVVWDGRDDRGERLASGVYFVGLTMSGTTAVHRVVLLK